MHTDASQLPRPARDGASAPYSLFTDEEIYHREQEYIFRGRTWSFLALDAELPNPGDFKATFIGDTPVVVCRDREGGFQAWVNRCAHRGAKVCRTPRGNARTFVCPYHQWGYDLKGNLVGVPFSRGYKGMPGMPSSFDKAQHGLQKLRVEAYGPMLFGTLSDTVEPLHAYLGAQMTPLLDRVFHKPVEYLGCLRQRADANWKLYIENGRDYYHGSLLHLFHNTFNIGRIDQITQIECDERHGLHACMKLTRSGDVSAGELYKSNQVASYKDGLTLNEPGILRMYPEFDEPVSNHIQSIFPSLVIHQVHNSLACRQILPKGPNQYELVFHLFGYTDDTEELRNMRLLQANLIGPSGYISMEDTEVTEMIQKAIGARPQTASTMQMGADGGEHFHKNIMSEEILRRFWRGYRALMELNDE